MSRIFKKILFGLFLVMTFLFTHCNRGSSDRQTNDPSRYKEPLIKANKEVVRVESEEIDDFIRRHGWKMNTTRTGLRWEIVKRGEGPEARTGKTVRLSYTLSLLNGDTVYTSQKDGPLIFTVGNAQVISGLEEGILLLHVGDHAKFIIPSHLAFGLIGDQKKIFHKASLVYDIDFNSMY